MVVYSQVYAYDDILTNNEFNSTKAWELTKTLDRPINCSNISINNLSRTYDVLSESYNNILNVYTNLNNNDKSGYDIVETDNLTQDLLKLTNELTKEALYYNLDWMYKNLNSLNENISKHVPSNFENVLRCVGFNMAYEVSKGYEEANRTYPNR